MRAFHFTFQKLKKYKSGKKKKKWLSPQNKITVKTNTYPP